MTPDEWEALLESEGLPSEPTPIPRGFKRYGRYCDNSELADVELSKPWAEQAANKPVYPALDPETARQADVTRLTVKERELWALYLQTGSERRLARSLGISRYRLWVVWLGPIREKLGLPGERWGI